MKHIKGLAENAIVRGKDYNRLLELLLANRVHVNGSGLSLQQTSSGVYLSTTHSMVDAVHGAFDGGDGSGMLMDMFVATISSATAYVDNIWNYTCTKVHKTGITGYETGAWFAVWDTPQPAFNLIEFGNSGVGVQGNGVDIDGADFPETFALQPCPVGTLVMMYTIQLPLSAGIEYWFQYENGVDGTCT